MNEQHNRLKVRRLLEALLLLGVVAAVVAVLVRLWQRRRRAEPREVPQPPPPTIPPGVRGLTEAEAQARQQEGQDNVVRFEPVRTRQDIVRDNVLTVFNVSLVGMACFQLLVGRYLDGLISFGAAALNIATKIRQELQAGKKLQELEQQTRPRATVIREGRARSIDPNQIVRGDVLVVGPGDGFLVDGELLSEQPILVDQSMLTDEGNRIARQAGDPVYAGSFCVAGRAAYQAQKVGDERLVATLTADSRATRKTRTPMERIVDRVLSLMLVVVVILMAFLLAEYFRVDEAVDVNVDVFLQAAGMIFGLAPTGMYFMIFLTYVGGMVRLSEQGAIVHRARSIESLAQATVLCVTEASLRVGTTVEVEAVEPPHSEMRLTKSQLRQILGEYAHSSSANNRALRAMAQAFPGERRTVREEAPFLSVYGWSAITFDDDDLSGIFILGEPEVLAAHLVAVEEPEGEAEEEAEQGTPPLAALRSRLPSLGRFFRRSDEASEEEADPEPAQTPDEEEPSDQVPPAPEGGSDQVPPVEEEGPKQNPVRRLFGRVGGALQRVRAKDEGEEEAEVLAEEPSEKVVFLFAHQPDPVSLHDDAGLPQLPEDLIPLCHLHYSEQLQPETVDTIRTFAEKGVALKVLTPGAPDWTVALLQRAGLGVTGDALGHVVTGADLAELGPYELARTADENTVFSRVNAEQARRVVAALKEQGEAVGVVGDGPNDLPAMEQADLAITMQSSSQAALGVADIILLDDSPQGLLQVLDNGQRIVNGLLDVLKLNLTQLFYLTVLILAFWSTRLGFPYDGKQGSLISTLTQSLPSTGLSLWALAGALPNVGFGRLLTWFVGPVAAPMSVAALAVWGIFYDRTGEVAYAQLALTHLLVFSGLLVVLLIRPPRRSAGTGGGRGDDSRMTALILVLFILFLLATLLPPGYRFFLVKHLRQWEDYLIVGLAVLAWVSITKAIWWLVPLRRLRAASQN
jgi:magnesium-transporting ATPase (P-type)